MTEKYIVISSQVAILQDTCDSSAMRNICQNCDVLIHEATNEDCHEEKSIENGHSTPNMAARFADETNSKFLVLNHVSQRYVNVKVYLLTFDVEGF